jgi:chromosome segregation ATPase
MSMQPSLESRIKALEHRQYNLKTHTEELVAGIAASVKHLSTDMNASFEQVVDYDMKTERRIDTCFNLIDARLDRIEGRLEQVDAQFDKVDTRFEQVDRRLNTIESDIAVIKATMATKEDLATIRATMATKEDLATVKGDIATVNERLNRLEAAFDEHTTLLTQILERLTR